MMGGGYSEKLKYQNGDFFILKNEKVINILKNI